MIEAITKEEYGERKWMEGWKEDNLLVAEE